MKPVDFPSIRLSTGRTVTHTRDSGGCQRAGMDGDPMAPMTDAEWGEYTRKLKAWNRKRLRTV